MIESPTCKVPFCTIIEATAPRFLSSSASITTPVAILSLFAFKSSISLTNNIACFKSSNPVPFFADIGTHIASPPHSSGNTLCSANCCLILSGLASGLSILFIATIIGTFAALIWFIASIVCGITPSSAATIKIAISVALAPLALICVNAACPGVSINVIFSPLNSI